MSETTNAQVKTFDVHIGLAHVRVVAISPDAAVQAAREAFCREMPRLWDVIWTLGSQRFVVQPATEVA